MQVAHGVIYRQVKAAPAYHDFEEESVVLVQAGHTAGNYTGRHVLPLSIAAVELHRQLETILLSPHADYDPREISAE